MSCQTKEPTKMILIKTMAFRMTANMSDVKKAMMETQDGGKVRN